MGYERAAFNELMPASVTISTRASHNNYGEPSYGSGTSIRARIVHKPEFIRGPDGETIEVRTVVWVASTGTIGVDDRVTLPDGTTPPIVMVARYEDEDGTHHHRLSLGWSGQ